MSALALLLLAQTSTAEPGPRPQLTIPFKVGESFTYTAKIHGFGILWISVGTATMSVDTIETVRGVPCWKFYLGYKVNVPAFKVTASQTSWTSLRDFVSLRTLKLTTDSAPHRRSRQDFSIYPDSGFYRRTTELGMDTVTHPITPAPLDEIAFVYFLRSVPLTMGETVVYPRYYKADVRDLSIKVLKRETIELDDNEKVQCLVLQPVVNEEPNGIFRKEANARIWVTDDTRRIPVRIQTSSPVGNVRFEIKRLDAKG